MFPSHLQYYAQSTANNSEDQNRRSKGTHFISIHVTNQMLYEEGSVTEILFVAFDVI